MCVGCREMKDKKELVRIVKSPEGDIQVDTTGKKPGRGAYVCPHQECLNTAIKKKALQKALQHEIPKEITTAIVEQISNLVPWQVR